MSACVRCTRPTVDTGYTCWHCTDQLATALTFTVDTAGELETVITRQARTSTTVGGRSAETPLPYNDYASEVGWVVANTMGTWAGKIAADRGIPTPAPGIKTTAVYLRTHLKWLRCQPIAETAFDELDYACWLLKSTIDTRPDFLYLGPCNTTTDTGVCDRDLRAVKGSQWVKCPACQNRHDVDDRRRWLLRRVRDRLETAPVIATIISSWGGRRLPENTIYSWAHRNRLNRRGSDRDGRPLYRLGDAIDLADRAITKGSK